MKQRPNDKKVSPSIPPLVALPTDTDPETIRAIKAAGYIPVITDAPEKVRIIVADQACESGDMLMAALHGLTCSKFNDEPRSAFVFELQRRLKSRDPAAVFVKPEEKR